MPLHDWTGRKRWGMVHLYWMTEIAQDLRATLPPGYQAIVGSSELIAVDLEPVQPDVAVLPARADIGGGESAQPVPAPDFAVDVATLEDAILLAVVRNSFVVAVVELVSPRNKDRPDSRDQYGTRYLNYLRNGVNLMLVDVHRRPLAFSFPQYLVTALELPTPPVAAPGAASYGLRGRAAGGGRTLDIWQRPMTVDQPLPALPLALLGEDRVNIDLEATYMRAATKSYIT